ncbi:hypothetical protein [Pedobacter soli]|uniref:MORN repeat variant n=1 Tax=Pedobacter soli TaxID=390242 RepID=A0A1G6I5R7_9SPHI|nr:hypothetical protein [Pedobacter soli]SDC01385.1 hypothetical protein SAMN04488024_10126 [Pedobacter soli]
MKLQTATKRNWIMSIGLLILSLFLSIFTAHAQGSGEQIKDTIIVLQKLEDGTLDTIKQEKKSTKIIAGEKPYIYNITKNGIKKYYDHYGNELNSNGEKLPSAAIPRSYANNSKVGTSELIKSGTATIDGKDYFYAKAKNGATIYYDRFGNGVNDKQNKSNRDEGTGRTSSNGKIGKDTLLEKSGTKIINRKVYYYAKSKQGLMEYYDQYGNRVNMEGELIKPKRQ